jgi:putative hydrolase of the HAD superfamily
VKALLFDLDDTLYAESDFVTSGFYAVARHPGVRPRIAHRRAFELMTGVFASKGRRRVLPALRKRLLDPTLSLQELVRAYREHSPRIRLLPGYGTLLRGLRRHYSLGLITDGLPAVQRRKVAALGLEALFDRIIYTWEHGREREKPNPYAFHLMLRELDVKAAEVLYVGDNARKDGVGAHRAGIAFVHVRSFVDATVPHTGLGGRASPFHVESLHQLPDLLASLG